MTTPVSPEGRCEPPLRINAADPADLDRWAKKLGVAPEVLHAAVKAAGDCADDVAAYLAKRSAEGPSS
jgi:hypothetical protein